MKDQLTNENISKQFKNLFELVNYSIKLATNMIQTNRAPRVKMDTQNTSLLVLGEIACGKDQFDEIPVVEAVSVTEKYAAMAKDFDDDKDEKKKLEKLEEKMNRTALRKTHK